MKFIRVLKATSDVVNKETYTYKGTTINYWDKERTFEGEKIKSYHVFINSEIPIHIEGRSKEEVLKSAVKFLNHRKFDEMPKKIS